MTGKRAVVQVDHITTRNTISVEFTSTSHILKGGVDSMMAAQMAWFTSQVKSATGQQAFLKWWTWLRVSLDLDHGDPCYIGNLVEEVPMAMRRENNVHA